MAVNFFVCVWCGSGHFSSRMLRLRPQESSVRTCRLARTSPHPCKGPNQIFRHLGWNILGYGALAGCVAYVPATTGRRLLFMDLMVFSLSLSLSLFSPLPFFLFFSFLTALAASIRIDVQWVVVYAMAICEQETQNITGRIEIFFILFFFSDRLSPLQHRALSKAMGGCIPAQQKEGYTAIDSSIVHVPYYPPSYYTETFIFYYYYTWMDGVGSSTSEKNKIK